MPEDPTLANSNCPICQEKFQTVWNDEAQEWVWMDAVRVGDKIYHASCHAEVSKDGSGPPSTGNGAVLGKRKAEVGCPHSPLYCRDLRIIDCAQDGDITPTKVKIKRESES